jgi:hypothetical protein
MGTCVTVNVYRDAAHHNALTTIFASAMTIATQGVRASATATVVPANTSHCVWPIALPDRWSECVGSWAPTSTFEPSGPCLLPQPDTYQQPTSLATGSGHKLTGDLGSETASPLTLTMADFMQPITGQQVVAVRLRGKTGTLSFSEALATCNGWPITIGDTLQVDPSGTIAAVESAATSRSIAEGESRPTWNTRTKRIEGSCAGKSPPCAAISPLLVAVPLFDVAEYEASRASGAPTIHIRNFTGLFISSVTPDLTVYMATYPGNVLTAKDQVGLDSAFLRAAILYR